jgi:hypothetical protein
MGQTEQWMAYLNNRLTKRESGFCSGTIRAQQYISNLYSGACRGTIDCKTDVLAGRMASETLQEALSDAS